MDGLEFASTVGSLVAVEPEAEISAEILAGPSKIDVIPKDVGPQKRSMPKWETAARERVKVAVRRFAKPLADLVERDANEGDTRLLVTDFLCEGLGYDKYEDLTTEYQVKSDFADYGVRIDRQMVAFIEVKRCTQKLGIRHLRQVQMYAVNEGVEWMVLTNGQVWQVWHLTGGLPVVVDIALEVDLLSDATQAVKASSLFYLSKDAVRRRLLDELWKAKAAIAPRSLAEVLVSDVVIEAVRKEIRRRTAYNSDVEEIERILKADVLRADLLSN
ncbi:type I restriction enzyme HsdR N-terminal domain-containing protein [Amycolatopsis sp.]|uniref:type I restriction enzyme HsdR N-terminal domain-containing protein n=1 Tax=Amycolatopsis sp. TaxID=37632 RepID=UPI002628CFB8|nr:type I restriction enzyme HsdR N-terminal domain-containing protein [Amycolatopsis sp.]